MNNSKPARAKKQEVLESLMQAHGLASSSTDGKRLLGWRVSAGSVSGDLSCVAAEVISQQRQCERLSIADLHNHLDKLASSSTRDAKAGNLGKLIKETTPKQMKRIFRVVLGDMRIGVGEKTVLKAFHPDAEDLMSFCIMFVLDLHHLLLASTVGFLSSAISYDVVVGKGLKSQHSKLMNSVQAAWDLMKGRCMLAECKFDGDRMQLHKDGDILSFWLRAAVNSGRDAIRMDWLQHCLSSKHLWPITPGHYLHMSDATIEKQKDVVDAFGNPYVETVTPEEIAQVFSKKKVQDGQLLTSIVIQKMQSKFIQPWEWAIFQSVCLNIDSQTVLAVTLQRLGGEASMRDAEVAATLTDAVTRVIIYAPSTFPPTFTSILCSLQQQYLLPPAAYCLRCKVDATADHSNSVDSDLRVSGCLPLLKPCEGQESLLDVGPVETLAAIPNLS